METINRELAKQQATIQAQYNAQLNITRTNAQNAINLENQKAQAEINTRQQAFNAQVAQLQSFATTGTGIIASFAQSSITALQGMLTQAQQLFGSFGSSTIGGGGVVVVPDGGTSGGGMGGVQQPFVDPFGGGAFSPVFNITGNSKESILQGAMQALNQALSGLDF